MKWIFFLLFFSTLPSVLSVGITSSGESVILFSPGVEKSFSYGLIGASRIHTSLTGELSEYATINDQGQDTGPRTITVNIKLPQQMIPGTHTIYIVAEEISDTSGFLGGRAAIKHTIKIISLHPGKYPVFGFSIPDVNVNDQIVFFAGVTNFGEESIQIAYADIELFDAENKSIVKTRTNQKSAGPYESASMEAKINSKDYGLPPGIYHATARLTYDGTPYEPPAEATFNIGTFKINIIRTTEEVIFNSTNKYNIWIESDWSGSINDVYAKIKTPNGKTLRTPNIDLVKPAINMARAQGVLEAYWETYGLPFGEYPVSVELNYKGKTEMHEAKVKVIDGAPPNIERPKGFQMFAVEKIDDRTMIIFMNLKMPVMAFLMVVLAAIVIANVFLVIGRKRGRQGGGPGRNDISPPKI